MFKRSLVVLLTAALVVGGWPGLPATPVTRSAGFASLSALLATASAQADEPRDAPLVRISDASSRRATPAHAPYTSKVGLSQRLEAMKQALPDDEPDDFSDQFALPAQPLAVASDAEEIDATDEAPHRPATVDLARPSKKLSDQSLSSLAESARGLDDAFEPRPSRVRAAEADSTAVEPALVASPSDDDPFAAPSVAASPFAGAPSLPSAGQDDVFADDDAPARRPQPARPLTVHAAAERDDDIFSATRAYAARPVDAPGAFDVQPTSAQGAVPIPLADTGNDVVSVAWIAPSEVNRGEPIPCGLQITNTGHSPAMAVEVHLRLPEHVSLATADTPPDVDGTLLSWAIGRLEPHEVKRLNLGLLAQVEGDLSPTAAVTYTRAATAKIQVLEPQLAIAVEGPTQTVMAQQALYQLVVSNPGSGRVRNVVVRARLGGSLLHSDGTELEYPIGTLGPSESRRLELPVTGLEPGEASVIALARGDGNVHAETRRAVHVVRPTLDVAIDGPKLRFVDRQARYTVTVHNPSPAPANNVQVYGAVPRGFRFVEAETGGSHDEALELVAWFLGRLEPNETRQLSYVLKVEGLGAHRVAAAVRADPGIEEQTFTTTEAEGVASVVLHLSDVDDPVEVDGQTAYRIQVTNEGTKAARQVQVAARVPSQMTAFETKGPTPGTIDDDRVLFLPIESLEPNQSVVYHVLVRCHEPGNVRFRAFFRSDEHPTPVQQEEVTRIYQD